MLRFIINLYARIRARLLVSSARRTLEQKLGPYRVEHIVTDDLTLSSYVLESAPVSTNWDGEAYFPFWKKILQINVFADGDRPSEEQLNMVRELLCHQGSIRDEVLNRFVRFYNKYIYPDREHIRELRQLDLPVVRSAKDIEPLIGDPSVSIGSFPRNSSDPVEFSLSFIPEWRDGSGIEVRIVDWAIADRLFNEFE